jgi:hypothetical protein
MDPNFTKIPPLELIAVVAHSRNPEDTFFGPRRLKELGPAPAKSRDRPHHVSLRL